MCHSRASTYWQVLASAKMLQLFANAFAEYLRTRVHRFMRFSALQYNFSVPVPSHNVWRMFFTLPFFYYRPKLLSDR